jgi:hypothetical protein
MLTQHTILPALLAFLLQVSRAGSQCGTCVAQVQVVGATCAPVGCTGQARLQAHGAGDTGLGATGGYMERPSRMVVCALTREPQHERGADID